MADGKERCGQYWSGEDYLPSCQLAKGHDGDHVTVVSWPQWAPRAPRPPRDPNEPMSALEQMMRSAWGKSIAHTLSVVPVIAEGQRVVNRDTEPEPTSE